MSIVANYTCQSNWSASKVVILRSFALGAVKRQRMLFSLAEIPDQVFTHGILRSFCEGE